MVNYARYNIPGYYSITEIPSGHLPTDINTSTAQNWYRAFNGCINLASLPDPFYNTSNATDMSNMFYSCSNLTTIPNFDTSKVTSMRSMFQSCFNLTTIPNFDTGNTTDMRWMFYDCYNLATVPNFNTSNVTDMSDMFGNCENLTTVPNFDTSNVTNMVYIFIACYNLTTIPNFDTSNVTKMGYMFYYCSNIKGDLYIKSNDVINARNLFYGCSNYTKNIYCHANTTTYNTIYAAMGNKTYNAGWNAYLYTMEDNYAEIPWNGNGVYRFPTNKIMVEYQRGDVPGGQLANNIIEISPYTDYNLSVGSSGPVITPVSYLLHGANSWSNRHIADANTIIFRFFKDITNMTADVVDLL